MYNCDFVIAWHGAIIENWRYANTGDIELNSPVLRSQARLAGQDWTSDRSLVMGRCCHLGSPYIEISDEVAIYCAIFVTASSFLRVRPPLWRFCNDCLVSCLYIIVTKWLDLMIQLCFFLYFKQHWCGEAMSLSQCRTFKQVK